MAGIPVNSGPQNSTQTKPTAPAVLPISPPISAQSITPQNNIPAMPKQKSNSPWDDDLDAAVSPAKSNPTIIGSLESSAAPPSANSSSLKLPENVEETVGKKLPAADFMRADKEPSTPITPATQTLAPKTSPGLFGGLFGKKKAPEKVETLAQPDTNPVKSSIADANPANITPKTAGKNNSSPFKKILILVPGLIVVFAFATFLTEIGLLSVGLEKVYGAVGIEQLWGGLSPKTENALGRSALVMQNHPDFKAEGKIDITIDRAIKSDIVTPLLSLATGQSLARDESINRSEKAIKAASDDYYFTTNSNSNDNSNANANSNTNANSNLNSNANENINSSPVVEDAVSGTKLVEGTFNLKTSSTSNEAKIALNDLAGSSISLINDSGKLYVKTSGDVIYSTTDVTKWLAFNLDQTKDRSVSKSIFNLKVDSGFSVKGARTGNEKVDNIRCYKYKIDSLEIGSSLSEIGITSDMVPTLSGDVWIGIKDKLIHRMSIKITTPVSSAVRMVNLDAKFSDFDVKNSITTVSSSEQVAGQIGTTLSGDDKRKADISNLLDALKKYKADNKSYPISANILKLNDTDNAILKALVPRYLSSLPEDPSAAAGWYYAYKSANGTKCSVSARLENQSDTAGTLVNNVLLYLKYSSD